jgi:hypothetical protein
MGIAKMLTFADLLLPLHTLASRWIPARQVHSKTMRYVAVRPSRSGETLHFDSSTSRAVKPLRVVRSIDSQAPYASGRLVISGRMVDVCAELARLAELESRDLNPRATHLH